jgi:protein tyrosine/serine phosphatase
MDENPNLFSYLFILVKSKFAWVPGVKPAQVPKAKIPKLHNSGEVIARKIYRSDLPDPEFLETSSKNYKLKSIIYIHNTPKKSYLEQAQHFCKEHNINLETKFAISGKYPMKYDKIVKILEFAVNPENQPVLIHCHGGENRTGMICGIIRKKQGWPTQQIFEEYFEYIPKTKHFRLMSIVNLKWMTDFFRNRMQLLKHIEFPG